MIALRAAHTRGDPASEITGIADADDVGYRVSGALNSKVDLGDA